MAGFKAMASKYKKAIEDIAEQRQELALVSAGDAKELIRLRLQNEGTDSDGAKFKKYSEKPSPYWLINPNNFRSATKIKKFKKDAASGKNNASYRALRDAYGLPTNIRNFTFDGVMMASLHVEVEEHTKTTTTVVIKSKDRVNQDKINFNSGTVKKNILKMNKSESEMVNELNRERIEKMLITK